MQGLMSTRVDLVTETELANAIDNCAAIVKQINTMDEDVQTLLTKIRLCLYEVNRLLLLYKNSSDLDAKHRLKQQNTLFYKSIQPTYNNLETKITQANTAFKTLDTIGKGRPLVQLNVQSIREKFEKKKNAIKWTVIHNKFRDLQGLITRLPIGRRNPNALLMWRQNPKKLRQMKVVVLQKISNINFPSKETVQESLENFVLNCQSVELLRNIDILVNTIAPSGAVLQILDMYANFHKQCELLVAAAVVVDAAALLPSRKGMLNEIYQTIQEALQIKEISQFQKYINEHNNTFWDDGAHCYDEKPINVNVIKALTTFLTQTLVSLGADNVAMCIVSCVFCVILAFLYWVYEISEKRQKTKELCRFEIEEFKAHLQALFSSLM